MKAKDITPPEARCSVGPCPAIFKTDQGTYLVVGSIPAGRELPLNVRKKLGKGEVVVEIPGNLLPQ